MPVDGRQMITMLMPNAIQAIFNGGCAGLIAEES